MQSISAWLQEIQYNQLNVSASVATCQRHPCALLAVPDGVKGDGSVPQMRIYCTINLMTECSVIVGQVEIPSCLLSPSRI